VEDVSPVVCVQPLVRAAQTNDAGTAAVEAPAGYIRVFETLDFTRVNAVGTGLDRRSTRQHLVPSSRRMQNVGGVVNETLTSISRIVYLRGAFP